MLAVSQQDGAADGPRAGETRHQKDDEKHARKSGADEEMQEEEKVGHGGCPSRWGGGGL